jgi:hypothetical protein
MAQDINVKLPQEALDALRAVGGPRKTKGVWPAVKRLGSRGLIVGGAIAAGTAGIAGLAKAHDALTFKKDYENMLSFAPEIKDYDERAVKARFNTLRRFNPEMSSDPLVASSWIKQTIEYPVVTPATLKDVVRPRDTGVGIGDLAKILSVKDVP